MKNSILVVGLAKSGTSICHARIYESLPNAPYIFEPEPPSSTLLDIDLHRKICSNKNGAVVKSLIGFQGSNNFKEIISLYDKVIWIYRDPRDQMISQFFYYSFWGYKNNSDKFFETLNKVKIKEEKPSAINFHELNPKLTNLNLINYQYSNLIKFITPNIDSIFQLKYEDLIAEKTQNLEEYLGFKLNPNAKVKEQFKRIERNAKYGDWRIWFTDSDNEYYKPLNPILDNLKYDTLDWKLDYPTKISSQNGSEYMLKLFLNN